MEWVAIGVIVLYLYSMGKTINEKNKVLEDAIEYLNDRIKSLERDRDKNASDKLHQAIHDS